MHLSVQSRAVCLVVFVTLLAADRVVAAEPAHDMAATTAFTQSKVTDFKGHVTFRVGGVFSDRQDAGRRLSMTFICEPKKPAELSLFIVQQGARVPTNGKALVELQVDTHPALRPAADRTVQARLSAYLITRPAEARDAAQSMRKGTTMLLTLDGNAYSIPLKGLDAELRSLSSACPGWEPE